MSDFQVALLAGLFSLLASIVTGTFSYKGVKKANDKQTALMDYRLQQLEKKVGQHNGLETRVVALETKMEAYHSA